MYKILLLHIKSYIKDIIEGLKEELSGKNIGKNFPKSFFWFIGVIVSVYIAININNWYEGGSELIINDVNYSIRLNPLIDPKTSEVISDERYEIIVLTKVTNNKNSNYLAKITNAEYFILNQNLQMIWYWRSDMVDISIIPGTTYLKDDARNVPLNPGIYSLITMIDYEDAKGKRTPLKFSSKVIILDGQPPKIEDNHDWYGMRS